MFDGFTFTFHNKHRLKNSYLIYNTFLKQKHYYQLIDENW